MGNMSREQNELDGYNQRPGLESQMSSDEGESDGETPSDANPKLLRELRKLDTTYNPTIKAHETGRETTRFLVDIA